MASDIMNTMFSGKYYKVQPDGKAQKGLAEGDRVVTNGGTYQILEVKGDGSYHSALYDSGMNTKTYKGKYENAENSAFKNNGRKSESYRDETKKRYEESLKNYPDNPKIPVYRSRYKRDMDRLLEKLEDRGEFKYELNSDPLYRQYRESYMNMGRQAMEDVSGRAAAMTGGYGNTYAASASSAAYERYLKRLGDKIPELQANARAQYDAEGNRLYRLYSIYSSADRDEYGRYRDDVRDGISERDYLYRQYLDEVSIAQKDYHNAVSEEQKQAELEYRKQKDSHEAENDKWLQDFKEKELELKRQISEKSGKSKGGNSGKGKTVTPAMFDQALDAYAGGGDAELERMLEKLRGSGYSDEGIEMLVSYVKKYSDESDDGERMILNPNIIEFLNYRG